MGPLMDINQFKKPQLQLVLHSTQFQYQSGVGLIQFLSLIHI